MEISEIIQPGWVRIKEVEKFLRECDIEFLVNGERDNRTDGEVHEFYGSKSGGKFEFLGNVYDGETYKPLLEWALLEKG